MINFLGIAFIIISVIVAYQRINKTNNKSGTIFFCLLSFFVGVTFLLYERVVEVTIENVGTIKAAAKEVTGDAEKIRDILRQIENQAATINLVAKQATEAESKLITLDEEISKIKKRNHMTELADKVISNSSRFAYDELTKIVDDSKKDSPEYLAAGAEITRVRLTWHNMHRITDIPGVEGYDDSGINYNKLTTRQLTDHLLSDKRWQVRKECAKLLYNKKELDVAISLVKTLRNEPDIEVVKEALESFRNITGMPDRSILAYDKAIEWWDNNKDIVSKKLKKK